VVAEKIREVLLIGAGFSSVAGIPVQGRLLATILEKGPEDMLSPHALEFNEFRLGVREALGTIFKRENNLGGITLEDFYTVIDLAIMKREPIPPYGWPELVNIRRLVDACIQYVCNTNLREGALGFYRKIAQCMWREHGSKWATLSLNWDTLWDQGLHEVQRKRRTINYGFPAYVLEEAGFCEREEPLGPLILKPHGSFNWGRCPNCSRIFVLNEDQAWEVCNERLSCVACANVLAGQPKLMRMVLTPTMLKQLSGAALLTVWEKAHRILSIAERITFIGYSLPTADYELRSLFLRSIRPDTVLTVVLGRDTTPRQDVYKRYRAFFNIPSTRIVRKGAEEYFRRRYGVRL